MDTNNNSSGYGSYYEEPRWADFTLDDEGRARKRFSRFFIAASVYLIVASLLLYLTIIILNLALGEKAAQITDSIWFTWGSQVVAMYIIAFPIFYIIVRKMRSTVRVKAKMSIGEFLKLLCVGEALMLLGNTIGNFINSLISLFLPGDVTDHTEELIMNSPIWVIFLVAVVIGPIIEELIFRKLLMDKLGVYGDRLAIAVSALAFGLFHGNLYQLFYATFLGFVLAYIYSKTSNIIYPIAMHMIINFIGSVLAIPVQRNMAEFENLSVKLEAAMNSTEATEQFYAEYGERFAQLSTGIGAYMFFTLGLAAAGVFFLIRGRRKFFVSDRCEVLIPKERRASVILLNAGAILFLVISAATIVLNLIPTGA